MDKLAAFIVKHRTPFLIGALILSILSGVLALRVPINTDMTKYLPDDSSMKQGIDLMAEEFSDLSVQNTIRVMFENLSEEDEDSVLEKLQEMPYVSAAVLASRKEHEGNAYTLFTLSTDYDYQSPEELSIEHGIPDQFPDAAVTVRNDNTSGMEIPFFIFVVAAVFLFAVLFAMCGSWAEPFLFLAAIGIAIILFTLFPPILGEILQRNIEWIDVHNMKSPALYIEMIVENVVSFTAAYLECLLIGTIFFAVKAARHIPAFDKDYILILGCMIRKDGALTKLLQSRADRAVEFARMQEKATGKEIIFVPSGGQGDDEIMPEAQAIRNYLLSIGIPDERILPEDRSVNTYENLRNSAELIRRHSGRPDPKIAFSTTNYHVFRSGQIAARQGIDAEGIGSPTKKYFWINAFVREFVAMIVSGRRQHLAAVGVLTAIILAMVLATYYLNVL